MNTKNNALRKFVILHNSSISDIFSSSYWIKMLMKHMLPLVFLNYIVNCLLNMLKALIYIKGVHQRDGCSLSLLSRGCLAIVASLFPVFALSVFNTKPPAPVKICPCEEDDFVDTLIREIEKKERQRFLRNLQLWNPNDPHIHLSSSQHTILPCIALYIYGTCKH